MQHHFMGNRVFFAKQTINSHAIIANGGPDIGAAGGQVGKPAAMALAEAANLVSADCILG
jgi:hypothetical protein